MIILHQYHYKSISFLYFTPYLLTGALFTLSLSPSFLPLSILLGQQSRAQIFPLLFSIGIIPVALHTCLLHVCIISPSLSLSASLLCSIFYSKSSSPHVNRPLLYENSPLSCLVFFFKCYVLSSSLLRVSFLSSLKVSRSQANNRSRWHVCSCINHRINYIDHQLC